MIFDYEINGGLLTTRDLWTLSNHTGTPIVVVDGRRGNRLFVRSPEIMRCWIFDCPHPDEYTPLCLAKRESPCPTCPKRDECGGRKIRLTKAFALTAEPLKDMED